MADPHNNEYQAAVSGMQDTYGGLSRPTTIVRDGKVVDTYAVGDRIRWLDESGHVLCGVVVDVLTDDTYTVRRHVPDHGNVWSAVLESQILPY